MITKTIHFDDALKEAIDAYKEQFWYANWSDAMRELIRMGLIAASQGRGLKLPSTFEPFEEDEVTAA